MNRSKQSVLDSDFIEARAALLDVAAFLDRIDRADGEADYRRDALLNAIVALCDSAGDRARSVLEALSYSADPTPAPLVSKSACGAPNPELI